MYNPNLYNKKIYNNNNDRIIGSNFIAPFLLGGLTGGLLAPAFYPRPYYYPPQTFYMIPRPYPYYY